MTRLQAIKASASRFWRETRGAAAAEFVLWLSLLTIPVLNAVDLGVYAFQRMQLEIAAQGAVQAAWFTCNSKDFLPATENCPDLTNAMDAAIGSTSLGDAVTLSAGYPQEGWFCADDTGTLQGVGATWTIGETPANGGVPPNCKATTGADVPAGDYIQVSLSYTYTPVFTGVSVASLLASPITRTAWMRLN